MLFTAIMNKKIIYSVAILLILLLSTWIFLESDEENNEFTETVKVVLRDVGHQLLLSNKDSTSLVLPIIELENSTYELSFNKQLSFEPGSLVSIIYKSFEKATLPANYLVEVIQCNNHEVAYSYEIRASEEKNIIPCRGRVLPENCYSIEVKFSDRTTSFPRKSTLLYALIIIGFLLLASVFYKRKQLKISEKTDENYVVIGSYKFYPAQNKLIKEAVEISLSKKECELLSIFIAHPNQTIKREELTKKVWEDHGVIVGRSLDTYISKLRKKLKDDHYIKLTNVHGIGYKLEINN